MNNSKVILHMITVTFLFVNQIMLGQVYPLTERNEDSIYSLKNILTDSSKTQIFILGTFHLRTISKDFQPSLLDSLLIVLEQYRPNIIGVESLPPYLIEDMNRKGGNYVQVVQQFNKANLEYGDIVYIPVKVATDSC